MRLAGVGRPHRDSQTGHFHPTGQTARHRSRQSWMSAAWQRRLSIGAIVLACYLSGLLAVNLVTGPWFLGTPLSWGANHLFPRLGGSSQQLNQESIQAEWDTIQAEYVYRGVSGSDGTQGAEAGIVARLQALYNDQHVAFFTAADSKSLTDDLSGQRSGSIGISVDLRCTGGVACAVGQSPSEIVIGDVLTGQPADKAGVLKGDVLVAVNGTAISSLGTLSDAALSKLTVLVRGDPGTTVALTVQRGAQQLTLTATRQNLSIPSVYAKKMGTVLYMQVTDFGTDTGDLAQSLLQQNLSGTTGIILDLRQNGGGYVTAAQKLVSQFIAPSPTTKNVVVRRGRMDQTGNPNSAEVVEEDAVLSGGLATSPKLTLVILVDGNTASASEITTAALHDYHRALVVGTKTYGKGSVQQDYPLPDGNDLHLTVEKWFAPNGENVDGNGIVPDDVVAIADPNSRFRLDAQSIPAGQDPQVQAALTLLGSS